MDCATRAGTARAGQDYVATSGTLTFQPVETKTISVPIAADAAGTILDPEAAEEPEAPQGVTAVFEGEQTFTLTQSNPRAR